MNKDKYQIRQIIAKVILAILILAIAAWLVVSNATRIARPLLESERGKDAVQADERMKVQRMLDDRKIDDASGN